MLRTLGLVANAGYWISLCNKDPEFKDHSFPEQKAEGRDPPSAELETEETGVVTGHKTTHIPRRYL